MEKAIKQRQYVESKRSFEIIVGDSETVPNQAFTVTEVLQKFQAGTLPNISKKIYFEENPDFDNINPTEATDFDLSDATILKDQILFTHNQRVAQAEEEKQKTSDLQKNDTLSKQSGETKE
nr:MAG: hypothetical protein [Microvirus sp.]